jgi:hypothetical protein
MDGRGQRAAEAERLALDHADQRRARGAERAVGLEHGGVVGVAQFQRVGRGGARAGGPPHLRPAEAEIGPRALEHDDLRLLADVRDHVGQGAGHRIRNLVAVIRPVDGDGGDVVFGFDQNFVGHPYLPGPRLVRFRPAC